MDKNLSEHPAEPQRFADLRPGRSTQHPSPLIPVLALAFAAGCGTSGDFIPYSDLPPAAEQDEFLAQPQSTASTLVPAAVEDTSKSTSTTSPNANEPPKDADSVDSARSSKAIENSVVHPADGAKPAESATSEVTGPQAAANSTNNGTPAEKSDSTAAGPRMVVSSQSGLQGPADVPEIENTATEVREIKLLIPEKRFLRDRGTTALRVSYDDIDLLKVLNMEPVPANAAEHFPGWLQELNGKSVRIRGFMFPTFEASGLVEFTMARDNGICCFVRKPKIYDVIGVSLAEGVTTDYIEGRPFDVEGTFHIEPASDEQGLYRLYRISNARVVR